MGNLDLALSTVRDAITTALNSANLSGEPGQVFVGWATGEELHEVTHQPGGGAQVSVWPLPGGKSESRYGVQSFPTVTPMSGTTGSLDTTKQIATFGGSPAAGDVVHVFFGVPLVDAWYVVQQGDGANTIAAGIAAAINAYALSGINATSSGAATTLHGAFFTRINIGASTQLSREVGRISQQFQVTVWAPSPQMRSDIGEVIASSIGTVAQPFLAMSDGTGLRIALSHSKWWDKAQQSYSAYRWDFIFDVEFGITQQVVGTQVEGTSLTVQVNSSAPLTIISGGSS